MNIRYLVLISLTAAMGGYLFGFDFAVISGALPFLREQFGLDAGWEGFTAACLALGAITGCVVAGSLAEHKGRKPALLAAACIFAVSSLAMAIAPGRNTFIAARFFAGAGVGMASMLSPMYIAEIAPAQFRGRMVAINQLTIVIGILVTNLVNYMLRNSGANAWRIMFGLGAVPSAVFLLGVCWLPESPRWLLKKAKVQQAKAILLKLGGEAFLQQSVTAIQQSLSAEKQQLTNYKAAFKKVYAPALAAGVVLAVFQQLCGINVVFSYTSNIFESIGASKDDQLLQTVFIGGVNLVFTLLAMVLVDKVGRKPLMLTGAIGLAIAYFIIVQLLNVKSVYSAYFLMAAIGLYATTLGPVTWVIISEIFPNAIRSAASAIAVICLWAAYFILMFTFPVLEKTIGTSNCFYVYGTICLAGAVFIYYKVKETGGRSLEDMDQLFGH